MNLTHCKLKKKEQLRLLEFFVLEVTARSAASMLGIQANTAILFYKKLRQIISYHTILDAVEIFGGLPELDEHYLEIDCCTEKNYSEIDKTIVFGIVKKEDKIYITAQENPSNPHHLNSKVLKTIPTSIIYTKSSEEDTSLDINNFCYQQLGQTADSEQNKSHLNAIQNFWIQARRVLRKYNGISKNSFTLFLKECEFRFNYGTPKQQFTTLKLWCDI